MCVCACVRVVDYSTQELPNQLISQLEAVKTPGAPIENDLYLSLDELYYGCVKKIKISRRVKADLVD